MKYAMNVPERSITLTWNEGTVVKSRTVKASDFSNEINDLFFMYGMKQKFVDSGVSAATKALESGMSPEDQRDAMILACVDHLLDGDWTRRGDGTAGRNSYLTEAVADLYKISIAEAKEKLAGKSEKDLKALAANPKIAAKIAGIKAERAAEAAAKAAERLESDEEEMPEI